MINYYIKINPNGVKEENGEYVHRWVLLKNLREGLNGKPYEIPVATGVADDFLPAVLDAYEAWKKKMERHKT